MLEYNVPIDCHADVCNLAMISHVIDTPQIVAYPLGLWLIDLYAIDIGCWVGFIILAELHKRDFVIYVGWWWVYADRVVCNIIRFNTNYTTWQGLFLPTEMALQWRHNGRNVVPNHQPHAPFFRRRSRTVFSGADQRKHQSSVSRAFVRGIHWWPVNFPHKWPVTRKMYQWRHHGGLSKCSWTSSGSCKQKPIEIIMPRMTLW